MIQTLSDLPAQLRRRILPLLPEQAFLRRDRGSALFVTNAPAFTDAQALCASAEAAGFTCELRGTLAVLSPGADILLSAEQACPPPDFLCASLERLRGIPPCIEALVVFSAGLRLLEHGSPAEIANYSRRTRQLAALCLRRNLGGAYACTLVLHILQSRKEHTT